MSCPSKLCNPVVARGGSDKPEEWVKQHASEEIKNGMKEFYLSNETLKKNMSLFLDNIERGLKKDTHPTSIVKCFPTYVQDLPTGTEVGKFLALDLGGTNFRVLMIDLAVGKCDMKSDIYSIPNELMTGSGIALFKHIAQCLEDFVVKHEIQNIHLPLGFTFSFPLTQKGLRSGILVRWSKGFNIPEVVGQDVVEWLANAIKEQNNLENVDICAVLNDTTGTLMSCAWKNPSCRIGLIVGTGHNGCYYESQTNAEMFDEPDMGSGKVIINLEAAAFGDDGCLDDLIRTDLDKQVDSQSINPGKQVYEKLISGMYLGELLRLYILRFIKDGKLFGGKHADIFEKPEILQTSMLSDIESDPIEKYMNASNILRDIGITDASDQDMLNIRYICQAISTRSAYLVASTTCVLVKKVGEPNIVVGIDGSVYKFHPLFRRLMKEKMLELIDPGYIFELMLSEDGSGRGAALVAASVKKS